MTLTRMLIAIVASAAAGGTHAAGPGSELCQIWSCRIAPPPATASLAPDAHPTSVRLGTRDIPVSEQTIIAPSTDGELYACIGYDPFGDPELKCLLIP